MDYTDILKRAWRVVWRYKILWLFGFFAGGAGMGGGGGNSGSRAGSTTASNPQIQWAQVQAFWDQWGTVVVAATLAFIVFALLMAVVSAIARGGLVHLVNEAEEGREVRAGAGWHVGFTKWVRVFAVGFIAALPGIIYAIVVSAILGFSLLNLLRNGSAPAVSGALVASLFGSICLVLVLAVPVIVVGVMLAISAELGVRYVVLNDWHAMDALKQGWHDLRAKRGAFVMFLIQVGVSIGVSVVVGMVTAVVAVPAVLAGMGGAWALTAVMGLVAFTVLAVFGAAYAAFSSAVWTIFFRRMTGMQPAYAASMPAAGQYPPAPPAPGQYPPAPAPYKAWSPEMPPAEPAPMPPAVPAPPAPEAPMAPMPEVMPELPVIAPPEVMPGPSLPPEPPAPSDG